MTSRTDVGRQHESLAAEHLAAKGFVVVGRNVRVNRDEVDIVAWDGAVLVVVEVRSRRRGAMVDPLSSITAAKQDRLRRATLGLSARYQAREVRIDVVAVVEGDIDHHVGAIDFTDC